jgi:YbbR domain-containing protein
MSLTPLSWILHNWRLKLLSFVLTASLLGAVAFSENPPVFDTASVHVQFANQLADTVVMNPPKAIDVPVAGLKDAVGKFKSTAAGVTIDLANSRPGRNQKFAVTPKIDVAGVTVRSPIQPVTLTIEPLVTKQLDIEIRTPKAAPGIAVVQDKTYATCGNSNDRCQVTVSGAASLVESLKAYVNYDVSLSTASPLISPNEPISFEYDGHPIDLKHGVNTLPTPGFTPERATVQVVTRGGTITKPVSLSVRVSGSQACGYAINNVEIQPTQIVNVTGPIDMMLKMSSIQLDPVDIAGATGTVTVNRRVMTGSPQVMADPGTVRVTVMISQAFSCAAPAPAAAVQPSPSPSPH